MGLTGTTNPGQSEPESNSNEGEPYILQTPRTDHHHQMQIDVIDNQKWYCCCSFGRIALASDNPWRLICH